MPDRKELDERLSVALRHWFDQDMELYKIPPEARNTLVLSINLAYHEGISAGIDLGAAAVNAGLARGTRAVVDELREATEYADLSRDRTGVRPCDETRREEE